MNRMLRIAKRYLTADTGTGSGSAGMPPGEASDPATDNTGGTTPPPENKPDEKPKDAVPTAKYTEDDLNKLKADFEKQLQAAAEKAAADALKTAGMKPEEKAEYEQKQRIEELERREQEAAVKELRIDTLGLLAEKKLDKDFLDYVVGPDKDSTVKKIDAFKSLFDKAVQAQVETRLAGKTPPAGGEKGNSMDSIREQFKNAMGGF